MTLTAVTRVWTMGATMHESSVDLLTPALESLGIV